MHQQDLKRLKQLRYMDDTFMTVCLADNFEAVELILRIILEQKDITVRSVRTNAVSIRLITAIRPSIVIIRIALLCPYISVLFLQNAPAAFWRGLGMFPNKHF